MKKRIVLKDIIHERKSQVKKKQIQNNYIELCVIIYYDYSFATVFPRENGVNQVSNNETDENVLDEHQWILVDIRYMNLQLRHFLEQFFGKNFQISALGVAVIGENDRYVVMHGV